MSLSFLDAVVPNRSIQLVVSRVYYLDAQGVAHDVPNPETYAYFDNASGNTDQNGNYTANLVWNPPSTADLTKLYYIQPDILDMQIDQ